MSTADVPETPAPILLSDETLAALSLVRQPFVDERGDGMASEESATRRDFADDITAEQLADIRHALITGDDLLLILGSDGAGKSTLLTQLAANSGLRIQCFSVQGGPRFSTRNLFTGMLEAFKVRPPDNLKSTLDELIPCLQAMLGNNTLSVVVLDDADHVSDAELTKLLSGMLYLNSRDESLLRIAFAAAPAFETRIPDMLPEGADLPYSSLSLDPFDNERAGHYLDFLLQQASENPRSAREPVFDTEAIAAINARARGLPGILTAAAASELETRHHPAGASIVVPAPPTDRTDFPAEGEDLPPELRDSSMRGAVMGNGRGGWLASRSAKIALGALALLLIVGGLSITRSGPETNTPHTESSTRDATDSDAERLELIDEQNDPAAVDTDAADSDGGTGDDSDALSDDAATQPDQAGDELVPSEQSAVPEASPEVATDPEAAGNDSDAFEGAETPVEEAAEVAVDALDSTSGDDPEPAADNTTSAPADTDDNDSAGSDAAATAETTIESTDGDGSATDATLDAANAQAPATVETTNAAPTDEALLPADVAAEEAEQTADDDVTETRADSTESDDIATRDVPESSPAQDPSPPLTGALESPNWILVQTPGQWTIQMSASTDRASVEQFLAKASLTSPNSIYSFTRKGRTWHALVHGLYPSVDAAREAITKMPPEATSNQPWIRSVSRIQQALKDSN